LTASTAEAKAIEFLIRYCEAWSGRNQSALDFMTDVYADTVNFYGKAISKRAVMTDKRKFANRWPTRRYTVRGGSEKVSCNGSECYIEAIIDWYAHSEQRGKTATGVADFELTWDLQRRVITSETGKVLKANR